MITVILVIHLVVAIALVAVVLLQRSEGGGLGIGGGGMGGFLTGRSAANLLTRTTAILAAVFIMTSLVQANLSGAARAPKSILQEMPAAESVPADRPTEPTAPLAR